MICSLFVATSDEMKSFYMTLKGTFRLEMVYFHLNYITLSLFINARFEKLLLGFD
jgi:hypothetical protein